MKIRIEQLFTENGTEVLSVISNKYEKTKFDLIREDWRFQQQREKNMQRKNQLKIKYIIKILYRKASDGMKKMIFGK